MGKWLPFSMSILTRVITVHLFAFFRSKLEHLTFIYAAYNMRVGSMSAPVFMSANFQEDDVSICVRDFKICHVMPLIILMVFLSP